MPWKENSKVEQRIRFAVAVRREGLNVAEACRRFGVSRQTGYKWLRRFDEEGVEGMSDRSSAPHTIPHKTPEHIEELVVRARERYPTWGPRKLRALLSRELPGVQWPSSTTMGEMLKRRGLVEGKKKRRRAPPMTQPLANADAPNAVWSADFKGQFQLGNRDYCYPLTVTDNFSRMVLDCHALPSTRREPVQQRFEKVFERHGLPRAIRTDNGAPFASRGPGGLSKLSAWWLSLGIEHERIQPGHPEQNGRHERFHLTLKIETTRPPAEDMPAQQGRFDNFVVHFNQERPHEALGQQPPATAHAPAERCYPDDVAPLDYRLCDFSRTVFAGGNIRLSKGLDVYVGMAFAGYQIGLLELDPDLWLVRFANKDLGFFELGETSLSPIERGQPMARPRL